MQDAKLFQSVISPKGDKNLLIVEDHNYLYRNSIHLQRADTPCLRKVVGQPVDGITSRPHSGSPRGAENIGHLDKSRQLHTLKAWQPHGNTLHGEAEFSPL